MRQLRRRGQIMVLFALIVPALIFCLGVGLDLGWYYLNVSRLQNAADAAAVAGAYTIISDTKNFSGYNKVKLVNQYPVDNVYNVPTKEQTTVNNGNDAAAKYAMKNLSSDDDATLTDDGGDYVITSNWARGGDSTVTVAPKLYEDGDNLYYVVNVSEKIHHFFIGFLDDMDAPVVAVAMLSKGSEVMSTDPVEIKFDANGGSFDDGSTIDSKNFKAAALMEDDEVSEPLSATKGLPTHINNQKQFKGWSTVQNPTEGQIIDIYKDGDQLTKNQVATLFGNKTSVTLYAVWEEVKPINNKTLWEQMQYLIAKNVYHYYWYASKNKYNAEPYNNSFKNPAVHYYGGNRAYYTEKIDMPEKENSNRSISGSSHYYIDFFQTTDNRLGVPNSEKNNRYSSGYGGHYYGNLRRVHSLFNVGRTFAARAGHNDDPLYCRIESEPYISEPTPIRQIVININVSNLADGLRPLFFYYDGPDARAKTSSAGRLVPDEALPVILNLNADFKGVLFMPDVPVVINGNGHIFEGFIIAKEYFYLDTTRGLQVNYSSTGKNDKTYSDNRIHVDPATGDVKFIAANGNNAIRMYDFNATNKDRFNLSEKSKFRTFSVEDGVKYMYIFYDFDCKLDTTPFYDDNGDLIPLYKLDAEGNQVRITKWEDVKLYDKPRTDLNRKVIPQSLPYNDKNKGIVLLNDKGNPKPLYDEAGNPVYFCEDYVRLTGTYSVLTLDRVADGTRQPKEFLLTKADDFNVSNTDDWK